MINREKVAWTSLAINNFADNIILISRNPIFDYFVPGNIIISGESCFLIQARSVQQMLLYRFCRFIDLFNRKNFLAKLIEKFLKITGKKEPAQFE